MLYIFINIQGFPSCSVVKNPLAMQETRLPPLGREDPLEEGMATHFSILTWRIPWTEEPGRLRFMGSQDSDMTEWLALYTYHIEWGFLKIKL